MAKVILRQEAIDDLNDIWVSYLSEQFQTSTINIFNMLNIRV
jgi:hypothetical protein